MTLTLVIPNSSRVRLLALLLAAIAASAPASNGQAPATHAKTSANTKATGSPPTVAEAEKFISQAETRLLDLWIKSGRASWVSENFITDDTESISADADQAVDPVPAAQRFAEAAKTATGERIGGARHWDRGRLH